MRHTGRTMRDERGMALVIAMLVLLVITLLGIVLMASVAVNRRVAGSDVLARKALDFAEAGIAEATSRLRNGDAPMPTSNPKAVSQIYLAASGSIPAVGTDTTAMGTSQPAGNWLTYSSATKNSNVLSIKFKTDPGRTVIYRYDTTKNPAIQTTSGAYIYEITSTGQAGSARRTVVADVIATPIVVNAKAALAAGFNVSFVGNAVVCGYNHSLATPVGTGSSGRGSAPDCVPYETGIGDLPAAWSTGSISGGGASSTTGWPTATTPNQSGFYAGPWQMLGMTQSEFASWITPPTTSPSSLNGITSIDNDAVMGNQSTSAAFHSVTGEGLLYVDGDCSMNAGFTYTGLVYIEGDLKLNGQAWILGGMVVRGKTTIKVNGGATILYSSDAISQKLAQYGGSYTTIAWREN